MPQTTSQKNRKYEEVNLETKKVGISGQTPQIIPNMMCVCVCVFFTGTFLVSLFLPKCII